MAAVDEVNYTGLLATGPRVVETDEENERLIAELAQLDSLPAKSPEQESLAELLTVLIEQFEARYDIGHA